MDLLDPIERELRVHRETGRAVHLAHAARALDEARSQLIREPKGPPRDVAGHYKSRE